MGGGREFSDGGDGEASSEVPLVLGKGFPRAARTQLLQYTLSPPRDPIPDSPDSPLKLS